MNELTRKDLDDFGDKLISRVEDKLEPIKKTLEGHHTTLYGRTGTNGIVGEFNRVKGSFRMFKWISSTGFVAIAAKILTDIYGHK